MVDRWATALACAALLALGAAGVGACVHGPMGYTEFVSETAKQAFVFHDGRLAHLVMRTEFKSADKLPPSMAWIVPVPALPKVIETLDPAFFEQLDALFPARSASFDARWGGEAPKAAPAPAGLGFTVHKALEMGAYTVTPLEILDDRSGSALNGWLAMNGFTPVSDEDQRHYLRRGAAFLAIRVRLGEGREGTLAPLHVAWSGERLSVPLKLSSHSDAFDLQLYVMSDRSIDPSALSASHIEFVAEQPVRGADLQWNAPELRRLIGDRLGMLTKFKAIGLNADGKLLRDLRADPQPEGGAVTRESSISGTWLASLEYLGWGAAAVLLIGLLRRWRSRTRRPSRVFVAGATMALVCAAGLPWWLDAYGDYTRRARVIEFMLASSAYRTVMAEQFQASGKFEAWPVTGLEPGWIKVKPDGQIWVSPPVAQTGVFMRLKFIPRPDGVILNWTCVVEPAGAAPFAPTSCVPQLTSGYKASG